MNPIRPYATLRLLRDNADVVVACTRCGYTAALPFDLLAARVGWDTEIAAPANLLVHLRCGGCGLRYRDGDAGDHLKMTLTPRSTLDKGGYPEW